jgi:hypothetical protein
VQYLLLQKLHGRKITFFINITPDGCVVRASGSAGRRLGALLVLLSIDSCAVFVKIDEGFSHRQAKEQFSRVLGKHVAHTGPGARGKCERSAFDGNI